MNMGEKGGLVHRINAADAVYVGQDGDARISDLRHGGISDWRISDDGAVRKVWESQIALDHWLGSRAAFPSALAPRPVYLR